MKAAQARVLTPVDVHAELCRFLQLGEEPAPATLVGSAVRRLCSFMCPCPAFAIKRMACRSLRVLDIPEEQLTRLVDEAIEDLSIGGDLLELSRVMIAGAENHPSWLYCAPPSFIARKTGRIYILGIAADDASFLPRELRAGVQRDGAVRFIESAEPEAVTQLKRLGLREVNEAAWLTTVKTESAREHLQAAAKQLRHLGADGELPDLTILAHASGEGKPYSRRWKSPEAESGVYIGRVPQPYGAPLWYFCDLDHGRTMRSMLLPTRESRERASDIAWRLQLALDAEAGFAARYSVDRTSDTATLTFDFPVPLAVRRRLMFLGARRSQDDPHPFRFQLPVGELDEERSFLRSNYWIEERSEERGK
jgi:hypothetical protein